MGTLIVILHVIVCAILIAVVLLQSGKSADLAGAFGGVGSQTAFGGRGSATLLSKITTAAAVIFMLTSLGLWIISAKGTSSVVGGEKAPAVPAQTQTQAPVPAAKEPEKKETPAAPLEKKEAAQPSNAAAGGEQKK